MIYGGQAETYRYWFTAEYTIGAVRAKRRQIRVGTLCEPRGRQGEGARRRSHLYSEDLPLIEQYVKLGPSLSTDSVP